MYTCIYPVASICTESMIFLKIIDIRLDHVTEDSLTMHRKVFVRAAVPSANWLNCTAC